MYYTEGGAVSGDFDLYALGASHTGNTSDIEVKEKEKGFWDYPNLHVAYAEQTNSRNDATTDEEQGTFMA